MRNGIGLIAGPRSLALLLAFNLVGCASQLALPLREEESSSAREGVEIVQREREYALGSSETLKIENRFGELDVRANPESRVLLRAVVQKLQADADAEIKVWLKSGVFHVEVHCVRTRASACDASSLRVDLALAQPAGLALRAKTAGERLRVKGLSGTLDLQSESGVVLVDTVSQVRAQTSGDILATLRAPGLADSQLRSSNGNITIALPTSGDYRVLANAPEVFAGLDADGKRTRFAERFTRAYGSSDFAVALSAPRGSVELIGLIPAPAAR